MYHTMIYSSRHPSAHLPRASLDGLWADGILSSREFLPLLTDIASTLVVQRGTPSALVEVADYFIWLAKETGSFISNLKLQKLVYYAQGWHLAIHGNPLFDEDFQAWVHGPVIPELYQKYKHFGWRPITDDVSIDLPTETIEFLARVSDEYFSCDGYELERMTHAEAPWNLARQGLAADAVSTNIIEKIWMKDYYGARVEENS